MVSARPYSASRKSSAGPANRGRSAARGRFAPSEHRFDPLRELGLGQRPYLGGGDLAVLEQNQRRDATHAVFHRRLRVLVDIYLGDGDLALHVGRQFLQERRNRLARTAPFRPEI